ncbi:hypothetical protein B0H14DRAFT_2557984 [Mycena olivaceomarginata]|nr:hypothetical protein B0H14DRAFT_2557984 [Mycena olivaceomarginata]
MWSKGIWFLPCDLLEVSASCTINVSGSNDGNVGKFIDQERRVTAANRCKDVKETLTLRMLGVMRSSVGAKYIDLRPITPDNVGNIGWPRKPKPKVSSLAATPWPEGPTCDGEMLRPREPIRTGLDADKAAPAFLFLFESD